MTINIIITFALLAIALGVSTALTVPDIPVWPLIAVFVPVAALLPIVLFPVTCTIWAAAELAMQPPDAAELAAARQALGVE